MLDHHSPTSDDSRGRCRIEHRYDGRVDVLTTQIVPLAPLVELLLARGATGEIVVVDEDREDREFIRWYLIPPAACPESRGPLPH